jgi:hypothetical protein
MFYRAVTRAILAVVLLSAVAIDPRSCGASGVDSLKQIQQPLEVKIGHVASAGTEVPDTVLVTLGAHGYGISAFDFKIGCDSRAVDILNVLPGRLSDSCCWKFFSARRLDSGQKVNRPRSLWQAVAVAEVVPDSTRPVCYGFDGDVSILKVVLSRGEAATGADSVVPIFFFWEDCGDNTISDKSGDGLLMSVPVTVGGELPDSAGGTFPNRAGALPDCVKVGSRYRPHRMIDFHSGAIEFRHGSGEPSGDSSKSPNH